MIVFLDMMSEWGKGTYFRKKVECSNKFRCYTITSR